jgi:hypothetical protein
MFFGIKKSHVGKLTRDDYIIISKEILKLSAAMSGRISGCPLNPPTRIRCNLFIETLLFLSAGFIFRVSSKSLFTTTTSSEIDTAASNISELINVNLNADFAKKITEQLSLENFVFEFFEIAKQYQSIQIRNGIIAYTGNHFDFLGIENNDLDLFIKKSKTILINRSGHEFSSSIYKFRILRHYYLIEESAQWFDVCNWVENFHAKSKADIDVCIKFLSVD